MLEENEIIRIFKDKSAILDGHFLLTSGRHSNKYMQCAKIFEYPDVAEEVCAMLVKKLKGLDIQMVAGPALGGVIMAYEMGRQLGVKNIFAERENGKMTLRRGFFVPKGTRVLVTEDVVTTGGSVKEVIDLIKNYGGEIVGVASIVDRSGGATHFGVPFYSAIKIDAVSYEPDKCPLCSQGIPVVKPGSRSI